MGTPQQAVSRCSLVALPADFVALCVFLGARGASRVEFSDYLRQCLAALALQSAGLGGRANFAFWWTTAFVFGQGFGHFGLVLFGNGLARLYRRGVTADVPYELLAQGVLDHACMHTLHQLATGKLFKGATERGFAWQRKAQIKAAQSAQFAVGLQAIYQRSRGLQVQHRLG